MAAVHALDGSGWSLDHAREHVSVTLGCWPRAGPHGDDPVAGPILASVAGRFRRTSVHLSPSALRDGVSAARDVAARGRARGRHPQRRAHVVRRLRARAERARGAEAPCYASDMAHQVALAGASVDKVEAGALGALVNHGLDRPALRLARSLVHSNAETLRAGGPGRHHRRLPRGAARRPGNRDDRRGPARGDAAGPRVLAPGFAVTWYRARARRAL